MLSEMRIESIESQPSVVMLHQVALADLAAVMGPSFEAVMGALTTARAAGTSPPFALYNRIDDSGLDLEIGIGALAPAALPAGVVASRLPGGEVARAVYTGGYDGLSEAWDEFSQWIEAQGRQGVMPLWEVYVTDPGDMADPAGTRTELVHALHPA